MEAREAGAGLQSPGLCKDEAESCFGCNRPRVAWHELCVQALPALGCIWVCLGPCTPGATLHLSRIWVPAVPPQHEEPSCTTALADRHWGAAERARHSQAQAAG